MNSYPNKVIIDLSALVENLNQVKNLVSEEVKIMGVVKSDAYGHGALRVAGTLEKNRVDCLGVAYLDEAIELREGGIGLPIIILGGIQTREESIEVIEKRLTPVLYDPIVAEILSRESIRRGKKSRVHLKVDTGMGRLGISHNDIGPFLQRFMTLKNLDLVAFTSHLAASDEPDGVFVGDQARRFERVISVGRSMGFDLPLNSMANSAAIMAHKRTHFNLVRPGIMLYGGLPSPDFVSPVPLRPAMQFRAKVLQVRDLPDKSPISYGRTHYTEGPRKVAVLSAGYGDGLPRTLSNRGSVIIKGRKAPIVGAVCMNLTICDITGINDVKPGDEAVFLGSQEKEIIKGDDMATWAGTISYEVFCSIGMRAKKEFVI